jgi:hypothetical protein
MIMQSKHKLLAKFYFVRHHEFILRPFTRNRVTSFHSKTPAQARSLFGCQKWRKCGETCHICPDGENMTVTFYEVELNLIARLRIVSWSTSRSSNRRGVPITWQHHKVLITTNPIPRRRLTSQIQKVTGAMKVVSVGSLGKLHRE